MQQAYNERIRERVDNHDPTYWTKHYLLGLVSEVDEVLREIKWKEHRSHEVHQDRRNLALELADLTKYVLSLWEGNGFSLQEALAFTNIKSCMLEAQYLMEFDSPIEWTHRVVIVDIDGTVGDYRAAFRKWLTETYLVTLPDNDSSDSLSFDLDNGLRYSDYYRWKEEFEAIGGYGSLLPYPDAVELIHSLQREGIKIVVYTARPASRYKYIWYDTWCWLEALKIVPHQLHIGGEERILLANQLHRLGIPVVLLDDNPILIRRAHQCGIPVLVRAHPYNYSVGDLSAVRRVPDYSGSLEWIKEKLTNERHSWNTDSQAGTDA